MRPLKLYNIHTKKRNDLKNKENFLLRLVKTISYSTPHKMF